MLSVNRTVKFATFPEVLVIQANRFKFVNWVPVKIGIKTWENVQKDLQLTLYINFFFIS